jgi:hypothetical protein
VRGDRAGGEADEKGEAKGERPQDPHR